jgi:quercetin dioxygenase-like cupin family protein
MPFRLVRLYTGDDGESHVAEGDIELSRVDERNIRSLAEPAARVSFEETAARSSLSWHNAPERQYVITLSGTLEFETRTGDRVTLAPGDILLAEDTTGGGHRWRLVNDQPWRRVYVALVPS